MNTVPLMWGLLHGGQRNRFEVAFSLPSQCADMLAAGAADIGLVPAVELSRQPLRIIPGTGIACRRAVRSILLVSKVNPAKIQTLAADSSSRTSVALTRIILERRYQAAPEFVSVAPDLTSMLDVADAALIIGDPALHIDPSVLDLNVLDLGAEWIAMTGLPMVFAVWAVRPGVELPDPAVFAASCRFGLEHLDDIVRTEAPRRGISEALAREYLSSHIQFELGKREYEGLRLFLNYAAPSARLVLAEGAE